jgi:hypothetical protein
MYRLIFFTIVAISSLNTWAVNFYDSAAKLNAKNCTENTSSPCFTVVQCNITSGTLKGYVDTKTNMAFAFFASAHHFVSPTALLQEYSSEFKQVREEKRQQSVNSSKSFTTKRRLNFTSSHFNASLAHNGRFARTKVLINQDIPSCVKTGDLK